LFRDREVITGGPSICDESLSRKLELLRDAVEEVRDKDGKSPRRHGTAPPRGDGNGVISPMAFSWGDDMIEAGDKEPALDSAGATSARRLGVRCGRLPEDKLIEAKGSESRYELVGRMLGKSVRICSEGRPGMEGTSIGAVGVTESAAAAEAADSCGC
jgi:hypothetical protein